MKKIPDSPIVTVTTHLTLVSRANKAQHISTIVQMMAELTHFYWLWALFDIALSFSRHLWILRSQWIRNPWRLPTLPMRLVQAKQIGMATRYTQSLRWSWPECHSSLNTLGAATDSFYLRRVSWDLGYNPRFSRLQQRNLEHSWVSSSWRSKARSLEYSW